MNDEEKEQMITRSVREILGGKPVSDFPVDLLPLIRNKLYDEKEKAVSQNLLGRIKLIQHAFTQIQEEERKYRKMVKENEKLSSDYVSVKSNAPPQREVEDLLDKIISTEEVNVIKGEFISPLIKLIKFRIKQHICSDEFEKAQMYQELNEYMHARIREARRFNHKSKKQQDIMVKLENAERKLEEAQNTYNEQLNQLEEQTAEAIDKILQTNQKELDEFDQETNGPLPPFTKTFSSELQNLRETQRHLILCKRFKDAAAVRDKLREICEIELEHIEDREMRKREAMREQLLDLHNQRIQCALTKSESQRIFLADNHTKIIDALKQRVLNYERKLDLIISSNRLNKTEEPSLSLNSSTYTTGNNTMISNPDPDYHVKISKSKIPPYVRQLSIREPFTLIFNKKKISKIDELPEPRWKTIEPHRTETEVYSQIISSATSTPKNTKISAKVKKTPRSERPKFTAHAPWNSTKGQSFEKPHIHFGDEATNISPIRKREQNEIRSRNSISDNSPNVHDRMSVRSGSFSVKNQDQHSELKKKRKSFDNRNLNSLIDKQSPKATYSTSSRYDQMSKQYDNSQTSLFSSRNQNYNQMDLNINFTELTSANKKENTTANLNNLNRLSNSGVNYRGSESITSMNRIGKKSASNVRSSNENNSVYSSTRVNFVNDRNSKDSQFNSNTRSNNNRSSSQNNRATTSTSTSTNIRGTYRDSSSQNASNSRSQSNNRKSEEKSTTKVIKTALVSKNNESSDEMEHIAYGKTYTQKIDERRNQAMQTKKKIGLASMFGEKSDFAKFCETVPPSRRDQLEQYT
ncbi:hypothetical protein TRFO_06513 [Tritrichomonas foetus]|uniref:Uncharacterized protein n=1 Tax=Tritrichomonas foetus TaxID=1144522 RepID=A0A1J4K2I9_9EUKA|nr:hypothetical protein TRFO_06513 [Tritrichomonas foetus]|eukprot:OHT03709.1 hypothetical protein TRFO_06513 [Tritrichomonas foetus]